MLIYISITTKPNVQTGIIIHSSVNLIIMLISIVLVLIKHYLHGDNYPLQRAQRSDGVACRLHSVFSIISLPIPTSSLVLLTCIYYRAVFWAHFSYKLKIKHIILPMLLTWMFTIVLSVLWTSFHGPYSNWYCLPFPGSLSWLTMVLQSVITTVCVACFGTYVICFVKMIAHLRKEEKVVKSMRSRKMSNTRAIMNRFAFTFMFYISQNILMQTIMWLPFFYLDDLVGAWTNIMYFLTVSITDTYLYTIILLKDKVSTWIQQR